MKIPKKPFKIKVGPFYYNVRYSKDVADEGSVYASTHNNDQVIIIDPQRPLQKQQQSFLHEIFHACMFVSGLTYRGKLTEEEVCRDISMVLYQVIQDNPKIFKN